ncbi:NYN domain-containing protein [bacterium]|nr:NYN domain-containing protein [bacterium]
MKIEEKRKFYIATLEKETAVIAYLDLVNMFHWQEVLKWQFRIEDVIKQLSDIQSIKEIKVYYGFNKKDPQRSKQLHARIRKAGATLRTKEVKFIRKTIDEALLFKRSTRTFFDNGMNIEIEEIVQKLRRIIGNHIEEPKCNFDVEIALDMMDDAEKISGVLLFSGDSDLAEPLQRLKIKGKNIYIVGVRGMTAGELHKIKDLYIDFGKFYAGTKRYL